LPTEATVLLQRLTQARLLTKVANGKPQILDQHFPLLEFYRADLVEGSTRIPDVHCSPDLNGSMMKGTCLLNGEDITFSLDGRRMERNALEVAWQPPKDPTTTHLTKSERDSLSWMATLQDAFGKAIRVNPVVLNTPPGSNQPILARVQLTEGRLRTLDLTDFACTIVPPVKNAFNQRVATSFEFSVPFSNTVEIRMVANRNGRTTDRSLILRPVNGGDVELGIMNMEINRLVGMDPANGPRAEADFGVYSDLLLEEITGTVPFLRQTTAGDPAGAGGMSTCVPAGH